MILLERGATTSRDGSQSNYAVDGAKNCALWRMMAEVDPLKRRRFPGQSPRHNETAREIAALADRGPLEKALPISDPKGTTWGFSVQNEQGKLNALA